MFFCPAVEGQGSMHVSSGDVHGMACPLLLANIFSSVSPVPQEHSIPVRPQCMEVQHDLRREQFSVLHLWLRIFYDVPERPYFGFKLEFALKNTESNCMLRNMNTHGTVSYSFLPVLLTVLAKYLHKKYIGRKKKDSYSPFWPFLTHQ